MEPRKFRRRLGHTIELYVDLKRYDELVKLLSYHEVTEQPYLFQCGDKERDNSFRGLVNLWLVVRMYRSEAVDRVCKILNLTLDQAKSISFVVLHTGTKTPEEMLKKARLERECVARFYKNMNRPL